MLDLTPSLAPERAALIDLLADLDDAAWARPTECPAWTVHGLALHVLGDDLSLLARQRDGAPSGVLTYAEDHPGATFFDLLDGFNEQWVRGAGFLSPALVVALLGIAGDWTEAYYRAADPTAPTEPVGFFGVHGTPSPTWQAVAREYAERWIHHSQIRRALDLPPVDRALGDPAVTVVVEGLLARIPELAWVAVEDRRWGDGDGTGVRIDAEQAPTLLSRGLPLEGTIAAIEGEPALVATVAAQTCRDPGG